MKKTDKIFKELELNDKDGLFITKDNEWVTEISFPSRVKRLIEKKIKPDAFFCFDSKPMILFFENCDKKVEIHKEIWNFNECPIIFFIDNATIEIYNGFNYIKEKTTLQKFGDSNKLNDFKYFELVTGKTWEKYKQDLDYKNRVDYHLLENIKTAREILIRDNKERTKLVNAIIGKVIFVRYLIDRKVQMNFKDSLRYWDNDDFCKLLENPKEIKEFFEYLEDSERGFNGDLFPISESEYQQLNENDYKVLNRLLSGEIIGKNQLSLFYLYDFSIIPIEFISNVYEQFIGKDNQAKDGAYYTPLFLVDYILKETVEKHLSESIINKSSVNDSSIKKTYNYSYCKVLDPACGSGIFLVETLRKIIEKFIDETRIDTKSYEFKDAIKELALTNIFGIDKDLSAVQVAIFSIYLTLLDYLEPAAIENEFRFPRLLNTNFFNSDFFDEEATFNLILNNFEFNFIIGNPPWKVSGMDKVGNLYLINRKKREKHLQKKHNIAINNGEIAEGFTLRVSDFCTTQTKIAFIIKSTILYNKGYNENSKFRQYWLEEYFIDKVFELAPVRKEVFDRSNKKAIAPAAIIFYRYANGENTDENIIKHFALKKSRFFSMFKIFTINRNDYKKVQQSKLKEFDWLWKVLDYGSYLDFNFIRRLKTDYSTIKEIIADDSNYIVGTGIQFSSSPENSAEHLIGKSFISANGVEAFFINPDKISNFDVPLLHRQRREELFKAPILLIRKGMDMKTLTIKCAISLNDVIFKDSLTGIVAMSVNNMTELYSFLTVFSSNLLTYYAINTFGSVGIEREQTQNYNKFSLPYLDLNVNENIKTIEKAKKEIYLEKDKTKALTVIDSNRIQELESKISKELEYINSLIYEKLKLNEVELSLIDYALNVNKNLIVNKNISAINAKIKINDKILFDYANIFIERFKSKLDNVVNKFIVEIWHTNNIIGMFFKLIPINEYVNDIVWENKKNSDSDIFALITRLSSDKITDQLFVQKDLRGFEEDYFYIFKPNEYKLWHKAIGYLDVNEFADAILKAGRDF